MCRQFVQEAKESEASQVELFLNSVPLLKSLSREEKLMLVDALEEQVFPAGTRIITQASISTGLIGTQSLRRHNMACIAAY